MPTYRFVLEYAGTRYSGWQEQKNATTVAGELRRALEACVGPVTEIGGAGRTDAGVHALAQVAHVKLPVDRDPARLLREVNERLPADVNVLAISRADDRFHARHHAESRSYVYQVSRRRTAFGKRHVWWVDEPLDVDAMRRAAAACVGEHDFVLFCDRPQDQPGTHVRVDRAEVVEHGSLVLLRFEASHFLWRMVRRLVGAIVRVGRGELTVDEFSSLVAARTLPGKRGDVAEWTAPASGLHLERVRYPGDPPLGPLVPAFPIDRDS